MKNELPILTVLILFYIYICYKLDNFKYST